MKKRTTVYEDRAARREHDLSRHTLSCPHCGKPVLDHMTECPHCKGKLEPTGYYVSDEKKLKKIKTITYIIGGVISVAIIILLIVFRK